MQGIPDNLWWMPTAARAIAAVPTAVAAETVRVLGFGEHPGVLRGVHACMHVSELHDSPRSSFME